MKVHLQKLPPEQFGFRQHLSTTKQLVRITDFVGQALHNNLNTAILMLDVAKAFDRVWHEGLICKLIDLDFERELILVLLSFISNRTFKVSVGNSLSTKRIMLSGIPQGSVLGPILYLFYVADFPKIHYNSNAILACYADDTAVAVKSANVNHAIKKLQENVPYIENWCKRWKVRINAQKSQLLNVRKRKKNARLKMELLLFNEPVPIVNKAKYLGITINNRLTWTPHIENTRSHALRVMKCLYPIIGKFSKLDLYKKRLIYLNTIRPIMTYAAPAWATATEKDIEKLQKVQNKFLRFSTNAHYYVRNEVLHKDMKTEPLNQFIRKINASFFKEDSQPMISQLPAHVTTGHAPSPLAPALLDSRFGLILSSAPTVQTSDDSRNTSSRMLDNLGISGTWNIS
ncbi:putative RNA-directed DNA polymerase from transposon BS, partial [Stegodyphus mimosarum]